MTTIDLAVQELVGAANAVHAELGDPQPAWAMEIALDVATYADDVGRLRRELKAASQIVARQVVPTFSAHARRALAHAVMQAIPKKKLGGSVVAMKLLAEHQRRTREAVDVNR